MPYFRLYTALQHTGPPIHSVLHASHGLALTVTPVLPTPVVGLTPTLITANLSILGEHNLQKVCIYHQLHKWAFYCCWTTCQVCIVLHYSTIIFLFGQSLCVRTILHCGRALGPINEKINVH